MGGSGVTERKVENTVHKSHTDCKCLEKYTLPCIAYNAR